MCDAVLLGVLVWNFKGLSCFHHQCWAVINSKHADTVRLWNVRLVSHHHIAEALNPQRRHCVNLRSCSQYEARIWLWSTEPLPVVSCPCLETLLCSWVVTLVVGFFGGWLQRSSCQHSGQFARFEVFTWCCWPCKSSGCMMLCHWVRSYWHFRLDCLTLKMKAE